MSHSVKVKVRPGGTLQFPAICVNCSRPASQSLLLKKRRGRLTRLIDLPLCESCAAQLQRQSGEEERLGRLGRFLAILVALLVLVIAVLLLPGGLHLILRVILAGAFAVITGYAVLAFARRRSLAVAKPEKLAIMNSVAIVDFSWRATTFLFNNDQFARQFAILNESRLMENTD